MGNPSSTGLSEAALDYQRKYQAVMVCAQDTAAEATGDINAIFGIYYRSGRSVNGGNRLFAAVAGAGFPGKR